MTEQYCTWEDCVATLGKQSPHYNSLAPLAFDEFKKSYPSLEKKHGEYCESFFKFFLEGWMPKFLNGHNMGVCSTFVEIVGTMLKFPEVEITPIIFPYQNLDEKNLRLLEPYNISKDECPVYQLGNADPQNLVEHFLRHSLQVSAVDYPSLGFPQTELYFLSKNGVPTTTWCDILMRMADHAFENYEDLEQLNTFLKRVPKRFAELLQLGAQPTEYALEAISFYTMDANTKAMLNHQLELLGKTKGKSA